MQETLDALIFQCVKLNRLVQFPKNVQMVKWWSIRLYLVWLVGYFVLGYSLKLKFDYRKVPASLFVKFLWRCAGDLVLMLAYIRVGGIMGSNRFSPLDQLKIYSTNFAKRNVLKKSINGLEQSYLVWTFVVHFSFVILF